MERKLSFWDVIREYKIEIPVIQRDYAQGRKNSKAEDVRQKIVEKMANALKPNSSQLFFDFVYGRIDGDKFIPFDGQQRLTTLFLLHKYVFEKCLTTRVICCECNLLNALKRFSYATRQSSREFCQVFVEKDIFPAEDGCKTLSDFIQDQSWFFPDWKKDPTIMGMLVMLDEIDTKMKGADFNAVAEKLTSPCNCPITFHFVDMGKLELPDDIYVKMNARGKKLTPFENFKASLEQYLDAKAEASSDDKTKKLFEQILGRIKKSIDVEWLDLFWKVANPDDGKDEKNLPDSLMLSFVNRHFLNVWRQSYKQEKSVKKDSEEQEQREKQEKQEQIEKINARINSEKDFPAYPSNDSFVSWDIYEGVLNQCGIEACLVPIFNMWDDIWNHNNHSVKEELVKDCQPVWYRADEVQSKWDLFRGDNRNNVETYPSRVAFYALLRFYDKANYDAKGLSDWMRIVWNIIENSTIDSIETYCGALNLINKLSNHCLDIISFLHDVSTGHEKIESDFASDQVREECWKAKKIFEDPKTASEWETKIRKAENHAFFRGAIRFLFTDTNGNVNWNDFDTKWGNAYKYFDTKGVTGRYLEDAKLLRRLLAYIVNFDLWKELIYDSTKENWNDILLNTNFWGPVHKILINDDVTIFNFACYQSELSDEKQKFVQEFLIRGQALSGLPTGWKLVERPWDAGNGVYDLDPRNRGSHPYFVIHPRINLLKDPEIIILDSCSPEVVRVDTVKQFWGIDIFFKFDGYTFRWHIKDNQQERDVYFWDVSKNDWATRPSAPDDAPEDKKYYCFKVTDYNDRACFKDNLKELIEDFQKGNATLS